LVLQTEEEESIPDPTMELNFLEMSYEDAFKMYVEELPRKVSRSSRRRYQ
jgi:hypothetical protein